MPRVSLDRQILSQPCRIVRVVLIQVGTIYLLRNLPRNLLKSQLRVTLLLQTTRVVATSRF
jgi:hypothetical protein